MTGILTFHWADDCGAMLQAYALKRYLETQGEEVELIPYAPVKLTGRYWWCPLSAEERGGRLHYWPSRSGWKRNLRLGGSFWKRKRNMRRFRRHLIKRLPVRSANRLSLEKYGCVFVGSDQVWNPAITVDLDDAYVGNIGKKGACRLFSYAASFGGSSLPAAYREKFADCVGKNFAAVSVREKRTVPFTSALLGRDVADVLDPVLLLDQKEWEAAAKLPVEKGYVLIYWTEVNEQLLRYAGIIAERLHTKVVQISFPAEKRFLDQVELRIEGGPAEFIGYIQNAACVLTNSFHGTAFSILFKKPFLSFQHRLLNTRLEDLLDKLGLLSRMKAGDALPDESEIREPIAWEEVQSRLAAERAASGKFILDCIGGWRA
ncbi:MAG: polysaccharide pyruvyl transferase family protein [Oscillospiraceae bacterium]|nr:polysaccharide pyruvyl transferase family protein [Oscillospiraceae bacterium]